MAKRILLLGILLLAAAHVLLLAPPAAAQEVTNGLVHIVEPGDTWYALAWRFGISEESLRAANFHPNRQLEPAIGQALAIPSTAAVEITGTIVTGDDGGLLQRAATVGLNPWLIAEINGLASPYRPLLFEPIFVPGGPAPPKQMPDGINSLAVNRAPAVPGQALAIRGSGTKVDGVTARFAGRDLIVFTNGTQFVALTGTGAFFEPGPYSLEISVVGEPLWTQRWLVTPGQWTFEEVSFTGEAATIDAETIRRERERLNAIWGQNSGQPRWSSPFIEPLEEYLAHSSLYGARRSYNGGPYDRYHEGLDFSAYGGTPVYAPAAGVVSLAEKLAARGGAVIIDHGLGLFSGYYHLSEVLVEPGQKVTRGELFGRVGSSGLSTGNHLHWDLLVDGIWIDPAAWIEHDLACWLLEGLTLSCSSS